MRQRVIRGSYGTGDPGMTWSWMEPSSFGQGARLQG